MGDEHRGDTEALDELSQLAPRTFAERGIEIRQRFVEQQDAWLRRKRARECHALLLPTGQFLHLATLEADEIDQLQHLRHHPVRVRPPSLESERDIFPDIEMGESA